MSKVQTMPLEIWTDINGNAARTQFKGGTKYIRADAQATVEALQNERDEAIREHGKESGFWGRTCARLLDKRDKLQTALDAERERSKKQAEEAMVVFSKLSQLQALVRALPVVETELSDKHRAIHISASISINSEVRGLVDPLKALLDYRRTLDATTPARKEATVREAQVGTIHDLLAECIACAGVFDVSTDYEADKADLENATQAVLDHVQTLRDERDRLITEYVRLFRLCEPIVKMLSELSILPIGCSREQELAWKMAVKNVRHYQRDYAADVLLQAALTPAEGGQHE